jgi:hypothetical protein
MPPASLRALRWQVVPEPLLVGMLAWPVLYVRRRRRRAYGRIVAG